jgi:hypothetical protein
MKSIISIAWLFIALSFSCKTGEFVRIKPKQRIEWSSFTPECKEFVKKVVRKRWKVHKSGDCYFYEDVFYKEFLLKNECFIGHSFEQIEAIFGLPNKRDKHFLMYYLGTECRENYDYLTVSFVGYPEEKKVTQIGLDQIRSH